MYSNNVNRNLTSQLSNPGTVLFIPDIYKQAFRYFIAGLSLTILFFISTSYERSQGSLDGMEPEYISPATAAAFRGIAADSVFFSQPFVHGEKIMASHAVSAFYRLVDFRPVWIHTGGLSRRATGLLELLEHARDYGLEPAHYHLKAIRDIQQILGNQTLTAGLMATGTEFELLRPMRCV
jgi:hypothetical protein